MFLCMVLSILWPVIAGIAVLFFKNKDREKKCQFITAALMIEAVITVAVVLFAKEPVTLFSMTPALTVTLKVDGISKLFMLVGAFGFLLAGVFAEKYMEHEEGEGLSEEGFFLCFFLSLAALIGMDMADNLIAMYFFFEMVTLCSMPMVLVEGDKKAVGAALKYLFYSIAGAFLALGCIFFMSRFANSFAFAKGGNLNMEAVAGNEKILLAMIFAGVVGFGAKAGMFPLHGWLPTAHPVAPAPASAVLSGIITKAGVLGIVRLLFFVVGPDFIRGTWVQTALLSLALLTVFMGSMMAYREKVFKKRLAYSSVSQISYVLFGLFLLTPVSFTGALMQILYHATVKVCLFLTAGSIIANTGLHDVDEFKGLGYKLPLTLIFFTMASLSLIGIPPFAGFVSKWYLAQGALDSGVEFFNYAGPVVLLISALLTAGYLLPVTINGFFPGEEFEKPAKTDEGGLKMLIPLGILAVASLLMGIFSGLLYPLFTAIVALVF